MNNFLGNPEQSGAGESITKVHPIFCWSPGVSYCGDTQSGFWSEDSPWHTFYTHGPLRQSPK